MDVNEEKGAGIASRRRMDEGMQEDGEWKARKKKGNESSTEFMLFRC